MDISESRYTRSLFETAEFASLTYSSKLEINGSCGSYKQFEIQPSF